MGEMMIKDNDYCFACGQDNPHGLQMKVTHGEGSARAELTLRTEHQGWVDIAHGGIVTTILDEIMAHAIYSRMDSFVTAELKARYKQAAPLGVPLVAEGRITEIKRRRITATAEVKIKETGQVLATAESKFLIV